MPRLFFSLLLISIVLSGCISQETQLPTEIIEETEISTGIGQDVVDSSSIEVFLLESTIDTPIKYRLARFTGACLQTEVTCPKPEIIPQFRNRIQ
jgi:hypothetical protein